MSAAPASLPPAVLRSLDLAVRRRIEGLLPGEHATPQVGAGIELAAIRPYHPGDDVRHLDPNATARTGVPHVRVHVGERALTTWLVLDASASMRFGTAQWTKDGLAASVAAAVGQIASRRANRLGVVLAGASARTWPARQGRAGLQGLLAALAAGTEPDGAGPTRLAPAIRRADALARRRGLIVVVSDFRAGDAWPDALRAVRGRHGVLGIEVRDRRELALPAAGDLHLVDPETGRRLVAATGGRRLRERFAAAAAAERAQVAQALSAAGADHLVLATDGDWGRDLALHLKRRTRAPLGRRA